jgi:hypothetical protein
MKKLASGEIGDIPALTPMQAGVLFHHLKDPQQARLEKIKQAGWKCLNKYLRQ